MAVRFINTNDSQLVRDQQNAIIFRSSGGRPLQNPTNRRDVNNDQQITALDVLIVINEINSRSASNLQRPGEPAMRLLTSSMLLVTKTCLHWMH